MLENKSYSQNQEDLFVLNYFGDYKGTLLSIGENNGIDYSNARLLIEHGWFGHLVEPGEVFSDMWFNYTPYKHQISCFHFGIGERDEIVQFYESGCHIPNGKDKGLVSTTDFQETLRWPEVEFTERNIQLFSWETFYNRIGRPQFDFISIDAEGQDWQILQQIDLDKVGCKCLCIEYNSNPELLKLFSDYCKGFRVGLLNAENIIFIKP